jgi:hypothetical protein
MAAKSEERKYVPEESFAQDLAKLDSHSEFAGQQILHFNSLYGKLTCPESNYVYLEGIGSNKFKYLVGEDEKNAGEIWGILKPALEEKAMSMMDGKRPYLYECDVLIAKELVLPERLHEEVEKYEDEKTKKDQNESIEEQITSGSLFKELEESEKFYRKLIKIIKKDGAELSNRTVIGICFHPQERGTKYNNMLLEDAFSVMEPHGYEKGKMPRLSYGLWYEKEGYARTEISDLTIPCEKFVGEVKFILPTLPCGKNYLQKSIEWDGIWKTFREEEKLGLHPTIKEVERKNGKIISETYISPSPKIPCSFITGTKNCAPAWCHTERNSKAEKSRNPLKK